MKDIKSCVDSKTSMFGLMVLLVGVLWLLSETGTIVMEIPWVPVLVIVVALGMIMKNSK